MVTINTTQDLLRLLDENPEFREAARRAILTRELIALPAAFGAFAEEVRSDLNTLKDVTQSHTEAVNSLAEMGQSHTEAVNSLAEMGQSHTEAVVELRELGRTHSNDIGVLKGVALETRLADKGLAQIASTFSMRRMRIVRLAEHNRASERFNEAIWAALDDGLIDNSEYKRLLDTDLIVQGTVGDRNVAYCATEASYTPEADDVDKVSQSANILRKVFADAEVYAALYCVAMTPDTEAESREKGVTLLLGQLP